MQAKPLVSGGKYGGNDGLGGLTLTFTVPRLYPDTSSRFKFKTLGLPLVVLTFRATANLCALNFGHHFLLNFLSLLNLLLPKPLACPSFDILLLLLSLFCAPPFSSAPALLTRRVYDLIVTG